MQPISFKEEKILEDMTNTKYRPNSISCFFEDSKSPLILGRILIPNITILLLEYLKEISYILVVQNAFYYNIYYKCILSQHSWVWIIFPGIWSTSYLHDITHRGKTQFKSQIPCLSIDLTYNKSLKIFENDNSFHLKIKLLK